MWGEEKGKRMFHPVNPYMTKDFCRIILKLILLRRIQKGDAYSYALIKELDNKKISHLLKKPNSSVKNDIYNTVNSLEKSGLIKVSTKVEGGRLKKYYSITNAGKAALKESKALFVRSMKDLMKIVA